MHYSPMANRQEDTINISAQNDLTSVVRKRSIHRADLSVPFMSDLKIPETEDWTDDSPSLSLTTAKRPRTSFGCPGYHAQVRSTFFFIMNIVDSQYVKD